MYLLIYSLITWSLFVLGCQTSIFTLQFTSCACYGWNDPPNHSPKSRWWFTHENLLSLVWLVACNVGCSTMVQLIKWFWWSGTSTKRLVWLQMSPNVQQIVKAVLEGEVVTASGAQSIWGHVGKVLPLELAEVSVIWDCQVGIWHCSPALNTYNHILFLTIIPVELPFRINPSNKRDI